MKQGKEKITNTMTRILTAGAMFLIGGLAVCFEHFGFPAVQILSVLIAVFIIAEFLLCIRKSKSNKTEKKDLISFCLFGLWLLLFLVAAYFVGSRPWIILLLFMIISAADIGAWFFGRKFGGDKMWERLSANKTWAGQIAGIACGTFAAVLYGLLGTDSFMPQLLWIGISVSLLSQYGDLLASFIKRKLGVKDFSNILPGHGGILDRFDGWIIVLPIIWLVMM